MADDAAEIAEHPDLKVARTQRYLTSKGYKLGASWNVARLARAADPEGKTEIIIFYEESLAVATGRAPSNADQDLEEKDAQELFARLNSAVKSD